jgi:hypothetical protein
MQLSRDSNNLIQQIKNNSTAAILKQFALFLNISAF